jgi:hypothetical protein
MISLFIRPRGTSRVPLHAVKSYDMGPSLFTSQGVLQIFIPLKNPSPWPGFWTRNLWIQWLHHQGDSLFRFMVQNTYLTNRLIWYSSCPCNECIANFPVSTTDDRTAGKEVPLTTGFLFHRPSLKVAGSVEVNEAVLLLFVVRQREIPCAHASCFQLLSLERICCWIISFVLAES